MNKTIQPNHMKTWANRLLLLVAAAFVGSALSVWLFPGQWWPHMLLYISEAGFVGALADLFAVTALFRHPFGWKWVPHTAIIPKSRDKLIDGVVAMVEHELLSKHMLKKKIGQYHLVEQAIRLVELKAGDNGVAKTGWKLLSGLVSKLDLDDLAIRLDEQTRAGLQRVNLAPYAGKALQAAVSNGYVQATLDPLISQAATYVAQNERKLKRNIYDMLERRKQQAMSEGNRVTRWFTRKVVHLMEATDAMSLEDAADAFYDDLVQFLHELRDPHHELRMLIDEQLSELSVRLQHRSDIAEAIEAWKYDILERISLLPSIRSLFHHYYHELFADQDGNDNRKIERRDIKNWILQLVDKYWQRLRDDQELKDWLERYVQEFACNIIESEHSLIGDIVRKTLNEFTESRLVHFIESKVETDLQRIRVNGTLLGACAGALLYAVLHGVYQPLLAYLTG